ncbi:D-arabinono-1,4-lactone oxidase [Tulasnella sp. 419]|nr:D-arabinono-1,4-lactone oxidase [Tulasnella sp. 419]
MPVPVSMFVSKPSRLLPPSSLRLPQHYTTQQLWDIVNPIRLPSNHHGASFSNWAKTFHCTPSNVFLPQSSNQLPYIFDLARREHTTVRATGAGHSPSDIACTNGFMIRTDNLNRVIHIDVENQVAIVEGGMSLHKLHSVLAEKGLAMSNLGSISDQSIAGVVTTATHGTGVNYGVIPTHVLALDVMLPNGQVVHCSTEENYDLFQASRCGLGASGFIIAVTLQVEKAFRLRERREVITFDDAVYNLEKLASGAEHAKLWWFPATGRMRYYAADRTYDPPKPVKGSWFWDIFIGFHLIQFLLFLGRYLPSIVPLISRFAFWLGGESPSVVQDESHRIFNLDCLFSQYTTEWAIPYERTAACLSELRTWLDAEHRDPKGLRPHFPIEIRFSCPDDIWLSPGNGRKTCWIGIVQFKPYNLPVSYRKLFSRFENIMASHAGRPHWAKAHGLGPQDFKRLYGRGYDKFVKVLKDVDPEGIFRNEYVRRHVFGEDISTRVYKSYTS